MAVHMRTYHQDYLSWSRPYQLAGAGAILIGLLTALLASYLKNTQFLILGFVVPVTFGVPMLLIYRRRFADYKDAWRQEHPLGLATVQPATVPFYRCPICRRNIQIEKGFRYDLRAHYVSDHPDYLQFEKRMKILVIPIVIAWSAFLAVFAWLAPTLALLPIIGLLSAISVETFYASTGQRGFRNRWQTQHPQPTEP